MLIGRTHDYAWSLTSANHDVRDVFAEQLCNPDGSTPTRASTHYLLQGHVPPVRHVRRRHAQRHADPLPDVGARPGDRHRHRRTAGPYALTRKRSTFGRDGLNLGALKDMTDGKATTPQQFFDTANEFGFTFNWAYASPRRRPRTSRRACLPVRAPRPRPAAADARHRRLRVARLPDRRPAPARHRRPGRPAAELEQPLGARASCTATTRPTARSTASSCSTTSRGQVDLADDVSVMNRAATEDVRSLVWPDDQRGARGGARRRTSSTRRSSGCSTSGSPATRPRVDADHNGFYDAPGPAIMDAVCGPIAEAVMRRSSATSSEPRSTGSGVWRPVRRVVPSTRTCARLLGRPVNGPFALRYCGGGDLARVPGLAVGRRSTRASSR